MTLFTATERKEATRQALALLTASHAPDLDDDLIEELIVVQGDGLPLVTASILGLASGLLHSFEDQQEGAADEWLQCIGRRVEAMPEDEA